LFCAIAALVVAGCGTDPVGTNSSAPKSASVESFAGTWRATTPSFEFIGLSVVSKSSEQGTLGLRLTLSGLAWDGTGRIDGDSVIAPMFVSGTTQSTGTLVIHAPDAGTLAAHVGGATASPLSLTFVRER
jgi:hypothetical protein